MREQTLDQCLCSHCTVICELGCYTRGGPANPVTLGYHHDQTPRCGPLPISRSPPPPSACTSILRYVPQSTPPHPDLSLSLPLSSLSSPRAQSDAGPLPPPGKQTTVFLFSLFSLPTAADPRRGLSAWEERGKREGLINLKRLLSSLFSAVPPPSRGHVCSMERPERRTGGAHSSSHVSHYK
ncbi:unnamed protein product [Pleuronectes platessa]|uniref:Uncharacterized protein n=1 Tax=Pleuronectes platessa TaxID=8262 RepID=A0A9N7Y0L0_PLEPL|nr:unnamed protein product [Pleuronectes platessa]